MALCRCDLDHFVYLDLRVAVVLLPDPRVLLCCLRQSIPDQKNPGICLSKLCTVFHYSVTDMPARDIYHNAVKNALTKDGWTITQDPLSLRIGKRDLFIDLGAEKLLAAEKGTEKIAVEIKSFVGSSEIRDLENALGQFVLYQHALSLMEPERTLFLAIREAIYLDLFEEEIGRMLLERNVIKLVSFNPDREVITRWIP